MAAHLLNRAGFGGTPEEIQKLADLGMDKAVASLLDYENIPDPTPNPDWAKPNPEEIAKYREAIHILPSTLRSRAHQNALRAKLAS